MRGHLEKLGARTAVITGAGSGLGRALALELAGRGWSVGVSDIDDARSLETVGLVEEAGGSGRAFTCDVRSPTEVREMAGYFLGVFGVIGLLVNNAGVAGGGLVGEIPVDDWHRIVDTNLWGVIHGCHAFAPILKAQTRGHILNVASSAGIVCLPEMAPYNVAKAGVISLSETLRSELAPHRIGVTVACPTFFDTNLMASMSCTEKFQAEFARSAFENARLKTEDVAERILTGVDRNRLYVFPQPASRFGWASKRLSPATHHGVMALMCRLGVGHPLMMRMSKRGWT